MDEPLVVHDAVTDEAALLSDMNLRLARIETDISEMKAGINTIGTMMNEVAQVFDGLMQRVQKGGIGALLGGMMGGKNDG